MNTQDAKNFDIYESRERWAMNNLYETHLKPQFVDDFIPQLYLTPTMSYTAYDAVLYLRDKITTNILFKFIIEIKYRDNMFDTLLLEKKKYKNLLKAYKEALTFKGKNEDVSILYINFNQSGAFVFNLQSENILNHLTNKKNKVTELHNRTTYIKDDIKVMKDLFYLPSELAKKFTMPDYNDYKLMYELNRTKMLPEIKEKIKTYSIF